MTDKKLTQSERDSITNKVKNSGLTGMKALEYAEVLAIDTINDRVQK